MPRYRVTKDPPPVIGYKNGRVYFETYFAGSSGWVWYARREIINNNSVVLCQGGNVMDLTLAKQRGFEAEAGTEADRLLASLVTKGYAQRMPD